MAKLGMGKNGLNAKDLERELTAVIKDNAPKEDDFRRIAATLTNSLVDAFEEAIRQYRANFVIKVSSLVQGEAEHESMLLPEGTRFCRRTDSSAVFVIEHKPQVRILNFEESEEVNPPGHRFKTRYRLSLPYLILIPAFHYYEVYGPKPFFSTMCVAYRNEPLKSLNDMLYHPHLPNLGRPNPLEQDNVNGDVESYTEMVMCQGTLDDRSFDLESTNLNDMISNLQAHFWNSTYTGELATTWLKMQSRDENFKSLAAWEKATKENPLFILKTKWFPAIRLGSLLQKVLESNDQHCRTLTSSTARYVTEIHDATWQKVISNVRSGQVDLAQAFANRLEEILKRFAVQLAKSMTAITNDTVRRTVHIAITQALKEAAR